MSESREDRLRRLVEEALELSGAARVAFLERLDASDPDVAPEVREVVAAANEQDERFLEPPGLEPPGLEPPELEAPGLEAPGFDADGEPIAATGMRLGEFEILREIGRGGMATVYLAAQRSLDRVVALKVLVAGLTTTKPQIERFHREARAVARLHHPGIVEIFTDGVAGNIHWFAMEVVEGHDLAREIRAQRGAQDAESAPILPAPSETGHARSVARVGAEAAEALAHAHEHELVHRDVKPQNILLHTDGTVRLVDFGIARDSSMGSLTRTGDVAGTPYYMSPEQIGVRGRKVDHRTDVYSLGVVLYELASLRRPFDAPTSGEVFAMVVRGEPKRLRQVDPRIPRDLETIVGKAMSIDPADRYPDARSLADDLRRFLDGEAIQAEPPTPLQRAVRWAGRRRVALVAVALVVVGLFVGAWWASEQLRRERMTPLTAMVERVGPAEPVRVGYWTMDPRTEMPAEWTDLGVPPIVGGLIEPGFVRLTVDYADGSRREYARTARSGEALEIVVPTTTLPEVDDMRLIAGGTLTVSENNELSPIDGIPVHVPTFLLDAHEVSNGEYRAFLEASPETPAPPGWDRILPDQHDDLPVVNVSWLEARAYAEWIGRRLPTFAEWMWAARGEEGRSYPWPDAVEGEWRGNTQVPYRVADETDGGDRLSIYLESAAAVDSHPDAATASGLFHMLGNVSEWTESPFIRWEADRGRFVEQLGWRLIVGQDWFCATEPNNLATLAWFAQDGINRSYADHRTGFRCARSFP